MDNIALWTKAELNDYTKEFGYKYFVRIITGGIYAGVKRHCKEWDEVEEFADRYLAKELRKEN